MRTRNWMFTIGLTVLGLICAWQFAISQVQPVSVLPTAAPKPVTISFVGDLMLAGGVGKAAAPRGSGVLFAGVSKILCADDLTVGNLECSVSTRGKPYEKEFTFRANPKVMPGLRKGGIDAVTVANNHSLDYGRAALLDTLANAKRVGLPAVGAGENLAGAEHPVLLMAGAMRVALIAASRVLPSTSWHAATHTSGIASAYDPTHLLKDIHAARAQADIVVVYLHWGQELAPSPAASQRILAHKCIEAGADLVIGSHPHVLQGFEYYRGKLIAYSLGDFVFSNKRKTTAIVQVTFTGALATATIIPCLTARYRPVVISNPAARMKVLRALQIRSYHTRISDTGVLSAE